MRTLLRIAALSVAVGLVMLLTAGVALATTYIVSGTVSVSVQEKQMDGVNFTLHLPASLLETGLDLAHWQVQHQDIEELEEIREQLRPYQDDLDSLLDQLESAEKRYDMVQVITPEERIRVRKDGRQLVVDVDSAEATVHVAAPLDLLRKAVHTFTV
ncbi:MAG: hypothetical protein AAGD01_16415 [Acidobacteriota bacterium]